MGYNQLGAIKSHSLVLLGTTTRGRDIPTTDACGTGTVFRYPELLAQ